MLKIIVKDPVSVLVKLKLETLNFLNEILTLFKLFDLLIEVILTQVGWLSFKDQQKCVDYILLELVKSQTFSVLLRSEFALVIYRNWFTAIELIGFFIIVRALILRMLKFLHQSFVQKTFLFFCLLRLMDKLFLEESLPELY